MIEVYHPAGARQRATLLHAPRLKDLRGKTICELSNGLWEVHRTFPRIRKSLRERFPDIKIIPFNDLPSGVRNIDVEDIGGILEEKGCQALIVGNSG